MSALESHITTNPSGVEDECAKLTIDDISVPFVLTNVVEPGNEYTFSFWVKSDENGSITAADSTFATTSKWTKHSKTFVADTSDFQLLFDILGVYYIYHPQIEIGNIVTDWTPAPEDVDEDIRDSADDIRKDMDDKDAGVRDYVDDELGTKLGDYVKQSEYDDYKEDVSTEFEAVNGQISFNFEVTETGINTVDGKLQTEVTKRRKHITFDSDVAITIGGSSGICLTVDNDNGVIFSRIVSNVASETAKDDESEIKSSVIYYQLCNSKTEAPTGEWSTELPEYIPNNMHLWIRKLITYNDDSTSRTDSVAFGSWDGDNFYTGNIVIRVDERAQLGNFAYVPRSDGSLSFLKVGG